MSTPRPMTKDTVVMLRHDSQPVRSSIEAIPPRPPKHERLRCICGSDHFHVTRVDFVCTSCDRSYRD